MFFHLMDHQLRPRIHLRLGKHSAEGNLDASAGVLFDGKVGDLAWWKFQAVLSFFWRLYDLLTQLLMTSHLVPSCQHMLFRQRCVGIFVSEIELLNTF